MFSSFSITHILMELPLLSKYYSVYFFNQCKTEIHFNKKMILYWENYSNVTIGDSLKY